MSANRPTADGEDGGRRGPAAVVARATAALVCACGSAGRAGPGGQPATFPAVRVLIDLDAPGRARASRALATCADTPLLLVVAGRAGERAGWWCSYEGTVLRQGHVELANGGLGSVRVPLPGVRHRAELELTVRAGRRTASRRVAVLPATMLAGTAGRLGELRLGAADPTGRAAAVLRAEGAPLTELRTRHAREHFTGGGLILAGFAHSRAAPPPAADLDGRVRAGMIVLVVNPPPGWTGWGLRRVAAARPTTAPASFAGGFGRVVRPADLGHGPWPAALTCPPGAIGLVRATAGGRATLAAAVRVGAGAVIVTALPQMDGFSGDPVGRCLLKELVLWMLAERRRAGRKESTSCPDNG